MAISMVAKVLVCTVLSLATFWGVKHTHVGHHVGHRIGHARMKLVQLFKGLGAELGFGHHRHHHGRHQHDDGEHPDYDRHHHHHRGGHHHDDGELSDYDPSKCHECLRSGKDFCISSNTCIPRATFQCRGPRDHITGDKEFALHGNPEGIKHSMVCPDRRSWSKDCYFDEDCHAKVNWDKITELKHGIFEMLSAMKQNNAAEQVKPMISEAHELFLKAGMPGDRIDHILDKWVNEVYPEGLALATDGAADKQDCFFDKECHSRVNWDKVTKIKEGLLTRLELYKAGNRGVPKEMMINAQKMLAEAGVPEDRVEYITAKWLANLKPTVKESKGIFV